MRRKIKKSFDVLSFISSFARKGLDHFKKDLNTYPPFQLVAHFNELKTEKIVFKDSNNQIFVKPVLEVVRKKEFINQFSPYDAYLLGYLLGWEDQKSRLDLNHKLNVSTST